MTEAFEAFAGLPKTIVTDIMKTGMDDARTNHFKGTVNKKFAEFAQDFKSEGYLYEKQFKLFVTIV